MRKTIAALVISLPTIASAQTLNPNPGFISAWDNHGHLATALGLGSLALLNTIPVPSVSVLGGVKAIACSTNQFVSGIDTGGNPLCSTPTTGSSTAAAGSSGEFQTNSGGSLAGVAITGAVTIDGTTGVSTLTAGQAVANLGYQPVNKAGDIVTGGLDVAPSIIIRSSTLPLWLLSSTTNGTDHKNAQGIVDTNGDLVLMFVNDAINDGNEILVAHQPNFGDPPSVSLRGLLAASSFKIGAAQPDVRQLGQITATYTAGMLNTQNDTFRVQVGSADPSYEFGANWNTNWSTAAITGAVGTPAGTYSGVPEGVGWPDFGVQGIGLSLNTNKSSIGLGGVGIIGVTSGFAQGANMVVQNCPFLTCGSSRGLNYRYLDGAEIDVNVVPVGGARPTGNTTGLSIFSGGTSSPTGVFSGVKVLTFLPGVTSPWNVGFETGPGAAVIGLSLGPLSGTGASNSQPINLNSFDGGAVHTNQIYTNTDGSLQLVGLGGLVLVGLPTPTGTPAGTLCINSVSRVYIKTTAGACL